MRQTIYVDWDGHEILTEEGYRARIEEVVEEQYEDDNLLIDYLDDNYSKLEIFNMSQHDKESVLADFRDDIVERVNYDPCEFGLYYEEEHID